MALKLTRNIFQVKELREGDKCSYRDGVLTVNYDELKQAAQPYMRNVEKIWFEVCRPGENARIVHILDVVYPMAKLEKPEHWGGGKYPGVLNYPYTCGAGATNCLEGLSVMECWAMPWDEQSTSSGLQYARDCIVQTQGFYSHWTPFPRMINLIVNYEMARGKSAEALRTRSVRNWWRRCGILPAGSASPTAFGRPAAARRNFCAKYRISSPDWTSPWRPASRPANPRRKKRRSC